jgi:putative transcriptional regulator
MESLAGSFLVARHSLRDPNFRQTVVLILQHSSEGAFGVVVNRRVPVKELPYEIFAGGPCESPGLLLLHGHPDWCAPSEDDEKPNEVAPGIFLGDAAAVARVSDPPEGETLRVRLFTGYSGWGASQLEGETALGTWAVVSANGELLFDTPAEELWDRLAPPRIPEPSAN